MTKQEMIKLLTIVKDAISENANDELTGHTVEKTYFTICDVMITLEENEK